MIRPTSAVAVLVGLAGLGAAALAGTWIARGAAPDAVLAYGFGQALASADVSWSSRAPNVWLSSLDGAGPTLGKALSLGDAITIAGKGGRPERIEVTGLEQIDGDRLGLPGVQFQLVSGQLVPGQIEDQSIGAPGSQHVRFLFAVDAPMPASAPLAVDRIL